MLRSKLQLKLGRGNLPSLRHGIIVRIGIDMNIGHQSQSQTQSQSQSRQHQSRALASTKCPSLTARRELSSCGYHQFHQVQVDSGRLVNANVNANGVLSPKRNISTSKSSKPSSSSSSLATPPFQKLVQALKSTNQTCTIIESSCGGLVQSSLMSVPGSSAVYYGGTVAYNTNKGGKLLCGDEGLHARLMAISSGSSDKDGDNIGSELLKAYPNLNQETKSYIQSKIQSTRQQALSYCEHLQTDFAIAEGGATGPTFRPEGMDIGFAVLAIAGRKQSKDKEGPSTIEILDQRIIFSTHADRELNMRLFADSAAELCLEAMSVADPSISISSDAHSIESDSTIATDNNASENKEGLFLDRSSHIRSDDAQMRDLFQRRDALHVLVRGTDEVLFASSDKLALPTLQDIVDDESLMGGDTSIGIDEVLKKRTFLGRLGEAQTPVFAMFLPKEAKNNNNDNTSYEKRGYYYATTRSRAPMLTPVHNELALTATAYVNWQNTHRYCSMTGSPLEYVHGGTCAKSTNSDGRPHMYWPRQDPSIIVLVTNPTSTHALLARSPRHPSYLYTALAGFVEAGEDFESAVVREVHEEVGVNVAKNSINYIASQPWPFPRSCMIGMHAKAITDMAPISIDPHEIVDAQWFEKEVVYQAARDSDAMGAVLERSVVEERQAKGEWDGKLLVPSKGVLARTLVDHWLESN